MNTVYLRNTWEALFFGQVLAINTVVLNQTRTSLALLYKAAMIRAIFSAR